MIDFHTKLIDQKKSCRKHIPELLGLQARAYVKILSSSGKIDTLRVGIQIFTFHSVESVRLERQLRFLAENDYQPLTGDEVYECISGSRPIPQRSVCLTFDDGWESVREKMEFANPSSHPLCEGCLTVAAPWAHLGRRRSRRSDSPGDRGATATSNQSPRASVPRLLSNLYKDLLPVRRVQQ